MKSMCKLHANCVQLEKHSQSLHAHAVCTQFAHTLHAPVLLLDVMWACFLCTYFARCDYGSIIFLLTIRTLCCMKTVCIWSLERAFHTLNYLLDIWSVQFGDVQNGMSANIPAACNLNLCIFIQLSGIQYIPYRNILQKSWRILKSSCRIPSHVAGILQDSFK